MRVGIGLLVALSVVALAGACTTTQSSNSGLASPETGQRFTPAQLEPLAPSPPVSAPSSPATVGTIATMPNQTFADALAPDALTSLTYVGVSMPVPQALSSISGAYDVVYFTQPKEHGGEVFSWYPGQSDTSALLETGAKLTIHTKPLAAATLIYPLAQGSR